MNSSFVRAWKRSLKKYWQLYLLLIPVIAIVIVIITIGFIAKEISEVKRSGYHYDTTGGGEESPDANAQILANGGWTCPLCGNVLSDKVIQCRCGGRKGDVPKQPKDEGTQS